MKILTMLIFSWISFNTIADSSHTAVFETHQIERINLMNKIVTNIISKDALISSHFIEDDGCKITLKGIGFISEYKVKAKYKWEIEEAYGAFTVIFSFKDGIGWDAPDSFSSTFEFNQDTPGVTTTNTLPELEIKQFRTNSPESAEAIRAAFSSLHKSCYTADH